VFCGLIPSAAIIGHVARLANIPCVYSPFGQLHRTSFTRSPIRKKMFFKVILAPYLNRCTRIHAISQTEEREIREYGIRTPVTVVPLGLHKISERAILASRTPREKKHFKAKSELNLLFLGRMDIEQKGLDLIIQSVGKLKKIYGVKLHVYFAGYDKRGSIPILNALSEREKISDCMNFLGTVDEQTKWEILRDCDLFIHPSRYEGFARSLRESISMGTPILVTPESNMGELVKDFGSGECAKLDVNDICAALLRISNAPERLEVMRGRMVQMRDYLSWTNIVQKFEKLYLESLSL
jgi:glycosyltransferase involved in cell wall biosynthesis